ncbi:MAG: hypothetical protein JO321_12215 [Solirubrobacterales bacterium]|nr:hypothetical protein [Solirubrobacterales bacterium]MBV9536166.1 hypothetical protein [Solirubrobacterales bacterium]
MSAQVETFCKLRAPAIVAVSVVLAVAGCGSSSTSKTVSPATYVKSVCTSAASWFGTIQTAGGRLQSTVHGSKSLNEVKTAYVAFIDALLHATQRVEQELKAAGTPSVSGGSKISTEVVHAFDDAKRGLTGADARVRKTPTSSATAFETAAAGVQQTVQEALRGMASLAPQKNPELHAAAQKEPSCRRLRSIG